MKEWLDAAIGHLDSLLRPGEAFRACFSGERSEFVRFNYGLVRQAGSVEQASLTIDWIEGKRHACASVTLSGDGATDRDRLARAATRLREQRARLPEDPYLLLPAEVRSGEEVRDGLLPDPGSVIDVIRSAAGNLDLVGLLASGEVFAGFADSRGQRNWHAASTFNLDWSFYREADRAVKASYAGARWSVEELGRRIREAGAGIESLGRKPVSVPPGEYRVYLAPEAVAEILGMLAWGGFGLRAHRTRTTPFIRMAEEDARLHPSVTLVENTRDGLGPGFQDEGFLRPERVTLIDAGRYGDCLVSPRSAAEYGGSCNGASPMEAPESIEMAAGDLPEATALGRIGDGIYVSNLHYLNYSDRNACRLTGITRFATFAVRGGEIEGPLEVMRFDETLYRVFGDNLAGLTSERRRILDPGTYVRRSTDSALVPGALVEDFRFTL